MSPRQYLKAIVAALAALLATLAGAAGDGISVQEWLTAAAAALTTGGAVYGVPNSAPAGQPADPDLSEQSGLGDHGHADPVAIALLALVILVVLVVLVPRL